MFSSDTGFGRLTLMLVAQHTFDLLGGVIYIVW